MDDAVIGKTKQSLHLSLLSLGARLDVFLDQHLPLFQPKQFYVTPTMPSNRTVKRGAMTINKIISCQAQALTKLLSVSQGSSCHLPPKHRPVGFANGKKGREWC